MATFLNPEMSPFIPLRKHQAGTTINLPIVSKHCMKEINTITLILEGLGTKTWKNEAWKEEEPGWGFLAYLQGELCPYHTCGVTGVYHGIYLFIYLIITITMV